MSYCLSFPDDPVCPAPGVVEDLMALGRPPTPSPTPPIFRQPLRPLLMAADGSGISPVLSINRLALGYNPFLGLEPHEQMGIYMRNEIFQFHVDDENVFLVQAPNPNQDMATVARFAAPLEYLVTPMLADCSYSNQESGSVAKTRTDYMKKTWSSKSMGMADINLSASASGAGATTGGETSESLTDGTASMTSSSTQSLPGMGADVGASTTLNAAVGNSKESQTGRSFEAQGMSKSVTTRLKRSYYKAGLRLDRFNKESFTAAFRSDARELGHKPYSFNATIDFVTKYGAYIFDAATMGATLHRSFFFSDDVSDGAINDIQQKTSFADVNALVSSKKSKGSREEMTTTDGTQVAFTYTDVERIGEFNSGGPSSESTGEVNSCAIGATITPQVR